MGLCGEQRSGSATEKQSFLLLFGGRGYKSSLISSETESCLAKCFMLSKIDHPPLAGIPVVVASSHDKSLHILDCSLCI